MAIATTKNWPIHHLDIDHTYLHGHIKEDLYILPPEGYNKTQLGYVCKLIKSIYGQKQAGRM